MESLLVLPIDTPALPDYELKDRILRHHHNSKGSKEVSIHNEPESGYAVIKTPHLDPTMEDFDIMRIITSHIKSVWFGQ